MYELIPLSEHDFYLSCPSRIGLVRLEGSRFAAIDSGPDRDAAKKLLRALRAQDWTLDSVYFTHAHADHIGGSRYLQEQTGCRGFASGLEAAMASHPILEPMTLYGGSPTPALRHKFLLAQESRVEPLTEEVLPQGWQVVPLPGHSPEQVGYRTPDGTLFLGDCLAARETIEKYGVTFLTDVAAFLSTLERVKTMQAARFVPAHAEPTEEIASLAQFNIDAVCAVAETIRTLCRTPISFDTLLQGVFSAYQMTMNPQQHALIGSTVRSYLSWLLQLDGITCFFEDNRMLFETK